MNISRIIEAISIIKSKGNLLSRVYDEAFTEKNIDKLNSRVISKSKKSPGSWICYELDRINYPTTINEYRKHQVIRRVADLLDISLHVAAEVDYYWIPEQSIKVLEELLLSIPRSELIKHIKEK